MQSKLKVIGLSVIVGTLILVSVVSAPPAAADPPCYGCPPVTVTPDGLLARARSQMAELNGVASNPPPCTDVIDGVEYTGYERWTTLRVTSQEDWEGIIFDPGAQGTVYRYECYLPEVPEENNFIEARFFDAVAPQVLAQVAIDDALAQIPTQTIKTSPTARSLVAFDTWFWVDGLPLDADGNPGVSATASVPEMSVTARAAPGGIRVLFGDGTSKDCSGAGMQYAPAATSDCTHAYQRAGHYTVTSTILWTGEYSVNGGPWTPIATAVARTSEPLILPVDEAQAINKVMK